MNKDNNIFTRSLYATDASMYQMLPQAVATPKNRDEVIAMVLECAELRLPVLARGAGTSLTGQSINDAVLLDLSRHMTRVIELNLEENWVRVEPGMVCGELNEYLKPHNQYFAPDPATLDRACIGGMIANNSAGMRSVHHGMTIDHVLELDLILAEGDILRLAPLNDLELERKCSQNDREGNIYRRIRTIIRENSDEIQSRYPQVIRHSGGYALDALVDIKPWNLAKLICGSEGTLGIILEAKLNLTEKPRFSAICLAHFKTLEASLRAAAIIVKGGATAAELIDGVILKQARKHPLTREICSQIDGEPASVLVIETQGDILEEVIAQIKNIAHSIAKLAYSNPIIVDETKIKAVWKMRSSALGLMTTIEGARKPIPYIEDAAVPPEFLADYVLDVLEICQRYDQPVSLFGHASVGLIHIRPLHDLHHQVDINQMKKIQAEVFPLVQKYGGAWSGEHGDGIVRGGYNKLFFGNEIYEAFREIKQLFDPEGRMNPGKILDTPPIDTHLRFGPNYHSTEQLTQFHYREQGGMLAATEQCTGVGACRKSLSGVMCPSYMATRDEVHSTRGRANALRLALSGQLGEGALSGHEVNATMDLCLACKGCKGECPNSVDMVKLKSEVLYHHQSKYGVSIRTRFFAALPRLAILATGWRSPFVNKLFSNRVFRVFLSKTLGITPERKFPTFTKQRLSKWFEMRRKSQNSNQVILFNDTYTEYFQPQVGRAAIECLEAAGYEVVLATFGDSQRISITHGLLETAKEKGNRLFKKLDRLVDTEIPILVCEPSCASALADDLPDLLDDESLASKIAKRVMMIDHFLEQELSAGRSEIIWKLPYEHVNPHFLVHGHCHQKTLDSSLWANKLLQRIPGSIVNDSESGCCGMAGTFGYEKEHFKLSIKIARQRLIPKLNKTSSQSWLVSNGFSCRHQISDLTKRKSLHVVEALRMFIETKNIQ